MPLSRVRPDRIRVRELGLATLVLSTVAPAHAQLVLPKTIPVAQGDQFNIFPSANAPMAGISIALSDSLLDPFVNPAKATPVRRTSIYGSPIFYNISHDAGGGRTLPLSSMGSRGAWTGGLTFALQQIDRGANPFGGAQQALSDRAGLNRYITATAAREFASRRLSIGASAYYADLSAVDGVDMLYGNALAIDQLGHMSDLRLGLTRGWTDGRRFEALVLFSQYAMTHDVTYSSFFVRDPLADRALPPFPLPQPAPAVVHNEDRTKTWGLHLGYQRPLTDDGWRLGWIATINRHSHPKIPNYDIQSIPRDPGATWAYNLGAGISRVTGPLTFGIDAIYEPMVSSTWADSPTPQPRANGGTLPPGAHTIDNAFRFNNGILRVGVGREATLGPAGDRKSIGVQFGVGAHAYDYRLIQDDHIALTSRRQHEHWVEWTPAWGLSFRFPEVEIRYHGSYTTGVGRPGVNFGFAVADAAAPAAPRGGSIIAAPSGPLTLQDVHVVTHQIAFSLPIH
jgi:hypothetical protein